MRFSLPLAALLLLGSATAVAQQGKDTGVGFCPLHRISYRAANCPSCASRGGGSTAGADLGNIIGSAFAELLRGDPGRTARLEAEAQARALAYFRAAEEESRRRHAAYTRLLGQMKLENFDGDGGPKLKGIGGDASAADAGPALKLGTSAAPNEGDPMVVDLRRYRGAAYVATRPGATPDAIAAAALGEVAVDVPPDAVPAIEGDGLKSFQEANNAFRRSHHDGQKEAEYFNRMQAQREIVGRELRAMKAELEKELASEKDPAALERLHEKMGKIFATARAEEEAWQTAKAELSARRAKAEVDRTALVNTVNTLRRGELPKPPPPLPLTSEDRRIVEGMNDLAGRLGWDKEEQERLDQALRRAGTYDPSKPEEVRGVWRDVLTEGREKEFSDAAGPAAAGKQTEPMDCTIFALANAAKLPYSVVSNRAALLVRQGEWRPYDERVIPTATIAKKGLMSGEVTMLTESFGQADVVAKDDIPKAMGTGRSVLVAVSGRDGKKENQHQVVLSRTFQHGGFTWIEMLDSSEGPIRRLYVTPAELEVLLLQDGVAYTPDSNTVPMLLREAERK